MNTLYLVRHAQTQPTALPAETWALSDAGIHQARKLAELTFWQDVQIICASWEPKALQTAQIVAERRNLPIEPVFDLRELRRTENLPDYEAAVHTALQNPFKSIKGWEPAGEAQTRIVTAIERLLMLYETETLAIVSHGLVLTLYLAYLTDAAPTLDLWRSLTFASATHVNLQDHTILNRFTI